MFRAIIFPIFMSTRLCVTACGIMHPRCCRPATSWVHYTTSCNTQSSAPEDGLDHRPKHVELIGIISKPLLLHLVGVHIIYVKDARSNKYQMYRRSVTRARGTHCRSSGYEISRITWKPRGIIYRSSTLHTSSCKLYLHC